MRRRLYGVNIDDGVPLCSDDEFGVLFVDSRPEARDALYRWITDEEQEAILFGGQIGTGKTTLLNEVLRQQPEGSIIRMQFDTDCIDATEGGYTLLVLGQTLRACLRRSVSPDGCGMVVEDFITLGLSDWTSIADALTKPPGSLAIANKLREVANLVMTNVDQVRRTCNELLARLATQIVRTPVLVADGVDKFDPTTADYFSLKDTLAFLAKHKTLFEVNAVHLFRDQDFGSGIRKLFIGGISKDALKSIFAKRLGSYAPAYKQAFDLLSDYAGGNVRQGLRLLNAYYFFRTQKRNDHTTAVAMACHRVSSDLLSVPFGRFPADVFIVIKRDGYIESSLVQDQVTSAGANEAIYRNWLFLQKEPSVTFPTRWPARINPLIEIAIEWKSAVPLTPEERAVRDWAREHHVSPLGLNAPMNDQGELDWGGFWKEIESSNLSKDDSLNILQLLDEIGAGLFGVERRDRIIIAYKERDNIDIIRDFLVGKANTYGPFPCEEIRLVGGEGHQPVQELLTCLSNPNTNHIYSIDLTGDWTDTQLRDLEHRRDLFDNLQMLWWIRQESLKRYLRFWQQLRQLFRIYRIEEELWRGITVSAIESDIDVIKSLSAQEDIEGVRRLRSVLEFLRGMGTTT